MAELGKGSRGKSLRKLTRKLVWANKKRRLDGNERTSSVDIDISQIDRDYLDRFLGKIFYWSFTLGKIKPTTRTSKFRVVTHRHIPRHKLIPLVEAAFPDGCKVTLVRGYSFTHTFDVRTTFPLRWDEFIWKCTNALEDIL